MIHAQGIKACLDLQDLVPCIMKILQKSDHVGPALRIVECYLLLNQTQLLAQHMPAIFTALEKCVQAVLDYKESPVGPQFSKMRGSLYPLSASLPPLPLVLIEPYVLRSCVTKQGYAMIQVQPQTEVCIPGKAQIHSCVKML